jgi:hypothetical protein
MDAYVREFGVHKKHDEFYTDMYIRQQFYNYVKFVVSRYVGDPTIIGWELANDARCNSTLVASDQCNTNVVTQWHAEVSEFVRSVDPNHLVSSGYAYLLSLPHILNFILHQDPWLFLSDMSQVVPTSSSTRAFPSSWRQAQCRCRNLVETTPNGYRRTTC